MPQPADSRPWWHKSGPVAGISTLVIAVLGGVFSITTAFVSDMEKKREIELETDKQVHDLRLAYLDRLDKGALARKQVLEFMAMSGYDPELRAWAVEELKKVNQEVEALQADLKEQEKGERQAVNAVADLDKKVHDAPKKTPGPGSKTNPAGKPAGKPTEETPPPPEAPPAKVVEDYEHAQADLQVKQANVDRTKAALGLVPVVPTVPTAQTFVDPVRMKVPLNLMTARRRRFSPADDTGN